MGTGRGNRSLNLELNVNRYFGTRRGRAPEGGKFVFPVYVILPRLFSEYVHYQSQ